MNTAFIISRCQPFHNGHVWLIRQALKSSNHVIFIIGSADKHGHERNPFHVQMRLEMVRAWIKHNSPTSWSDKIVNKRITVLTLDDLTNEMEPTFDWGDYLMGRLTEYKYSDSYTFYTCENPHDICTWFRPNLFDSGKLALTTLSRFKTRPTNTGISATAIRALIKNHEDIGSYVPPETYVFYNQMRKILTKTLKR